jgi:hypothetical protein
MGLEQSDLHVAHFRWNTIKLLRLALSKVLCEHRIIAVSAALLLCFCDIFAGIEGMELLVSHWRGSGITLTDPSRLLRPGDSDEIGLSHFLSQL